MKMLKLALCCALLLSSILISLTAIAGQQYYEARSDAMGGAGVASSNREGAAFINPALLALQAPKFNNFAMLLPVVGADGADSDQMIDKFDSLQDSYDALDAAINASDAVAVDLHRDDLVNDLGSLKDNNAYVSAGLGFSIVLPTHRMPMAVFYKSYIDAIGVAAIAESDIDSLNALDPNNPPVLADLDSQGAVVAGGVSDLGVALSFPLSIVNMPIAIGVSPKFQRIDTYNYVVSANNFDSSDFDDSQYRNDDTTFNVDVGIAMEPLSGLTVGLSGRNLIKQNVETIESQGRKYTYQVEPLFTAGVAYDWDSLTLTSDIDLNDHKRFKEFSGTQYWRVGGELKATDWFALRLGYRHDMKDNTANIYSLGTGFEFGRVFYLDLTGMLGSDDAIGGVLQTSYHF
ncbi:conjugal transfer protein TraF [Shewanella eurypsychrophilus]|uniref:Conjugal transfer protein TraF n=1 Tax=Shewanella eurypsychrophilus TaxID=2593656 RepID=A0ABX6V2I6_9GAMM|nr:MULTISPECIES: conjugal transfer protein TraF [Shewanella]QFU21215.1 type IX secretion system membrane protein PorP/SprF [Shewanella sp. YLB-09]QPG56506.1 conjugal transfer protein TraF [Shewanella eurypsychrophilus]